MNKDETPKKPIEIDCGYRENLYELTFDEAMEQLDLPKPAIEPAGLAAKPTKPDNFLATAMAVMFVGGWMIASVGTGLALLVSWMTGAPLPRFPLPQHHPQPTSFTRPAYQDERPSQLPTRKTATPPYAPSEKARNGR